MDKVEIESKHAPPLAECAHCEHMLPPGLGEIECEVCGAVCKVSHQPTIDALIEEKIPPAQHDEDIFRSAQQCTMCDTDMIVTAEDSICNECRSQGEW